MKTTFLLLSLTVLVSLASCKKDKSDQVISSYPTTFAFSSAGNPSSIQTFTQTSKIDAPNHPTATDPVIALLPSLLPLAADSLYGDVKITFNSSTQLRYQDAKTDTTFPYVKVGNYALIGPYLYEFTSDNI
ncbi:MAG: hypothetical protein V4616_08830, partial [Bacteroidota bacterium]